MLYKQFEDDTNYQFMQRSDNIMVGGTVNILLEISVYTLEFKNTLFAVLQKV